MTWWQVAVAAGVLALAASMLLWRDRVRSGAREAVVFFGEVRSEVAKITWPGREELRKATLVILAFVAFVAALIGLLDIILQWLVVRLPGSLV